MNPKKITDTFRFVKECVSWQAKFLTCTSCCTLARQRGERRTQRFGWRIDECQCRCWENGFIRYIDEYFILVHAPHNSLYHEGYNPTTCQCWTASNMPHVIRIQPYIRFDNKVSLFVDSLDHHIRIITDQYHHLYVTYQPLHVCHFHCQAGGQHIIKRFPTWVSLLQPQRLHIRFRMRQQQTVLYLLALLIR